MNVASQRYLSSVTTLKIEVYPFRQMVSAVEHAHKKKIFHRDIKLENVLIDLHGDLRLCDFGLSAMCDDPDKMLKTTVGTLHYCAPEVLRCKGYQGAAADTWSLGVSLYVMTVREREGGERLCEQSEICK